MAQVNLFEKHMRKVSLFKGNREALYPDYIPDNLPHREKEIDKLAEILVAALEGNRPSNILIFGKTGTGKTAVVRYVGRELKRAEKVYAKRKIEFIYLNCETVDTPYSILQNLGNHFIEEWDEKIPFTGWPMDKVFSTAKERIDEWNGIVILVLDEIDKLVVKSGDDILYQLLLLDSEMKNSNLSIIGISNELKFTDLLDPRVRSRLSQEKMVFSPYNAFQLQDILAERVQLAVKEGAVGEDVIGICAAIAAQEHGDARRAIDLLRISIEIAEREGADKVNERHVYMAKNKIEMDCIAEAIKTLPLHSKIVLLGVALNEEAGNKFLTTGELYKIYMVLSKRVGVSPLTQRRISDLISDMDMLGLLNTQVKSFGRYGRTKIVELALPVVEVKKIVLEDELLVDLQGAKLASQKKLFF
ncbi:orc1/cdc6 family replication initiation protein [Aciduliprofundum sp. MAR08-339]|uniref:ORC1-type DNA replication protein n=1 Tax=Aciduliprofundum sp. (strain MAR08-339) TaxID=673860 RepID=UPI0002A49D7E|nr:orc1/cdc6 family replication initiation protein [Aciduliprofundum sp. MAR08-339]